MEPLKIFGIPISPPGYYLNSVLTNAQIELMAADVSVIDYNSNDSLKKKKRKKGSFDNTKASTEAVKKAADKWNRKYGGEDGTGGWCNVEDILGKNMKADVGVKVE